ncbi:WD40/YVTN/BNR-like repeat-containing protein [Pareuzebyella sediminis]|uniref:WD40/YVTN/BNR-like repeat-containing protein n=1 Tax=Pareuzebyella sediminis TaxID=2607998 RepID=UPI0011ECB297|nr:YCF48-related protein [Pareuzebyella sediminis]
MKKISFIAVVLLLIINCSKSSDPKSETEPEVDVSEGQTNWTKFAYYDTISNPRHEPLFTGEVGVYDIAIKGNTILLAGYEADFESTGLIWGSQDGGETWEYKKGLSCGAGSYYTNIVFASDTIVYAVGNCMGDNFIIKSSDGGDTWSNKTRLFYDTYSSYPYFSAKPLWFFDEKRGIFGNRKTTDGGASWTTIEHLSDFPNFQKNNSAIVSHFFVNDSLGYCNSQKKVLKTQDGGESWLLIYQDETEEFRNIYFLDEVNGFLVTKTHLLKTQNGGESWKTAYSNEVRNISFANQHIGFITTVNGVYKTLDSGENWQENYTSQFYVWGTDSNGIPTTFAPSIVEFEGENIGITTGKQIGLSTLPNGKAYIARTTTLGE